MWQSVKFICHIDASHWTFFMEKKQDSPGNMSTFELVKSLGLFTYMTEVLAPTWYTFSNDHSSSELCLILLFGLSTDFEHHWWAHLGNSLEMTMVFLYMFIWLSCHWIGIVVLGLEWGDQGHFMNMLFWTHRFSNNGETVHHTIVQRLIAYPGICSILVNVI